MNRLGIKLHLRIDIITVGIICLAVSNLTFFYLKSHPSAPPCVSGVQEPTVEIGPITYFIPVPQPPKIIVKIVQAPAKSPDVFIPDPNLDHAPAPQKEPVQDSDHPVSLAKRVIVPDSLHYPMEAMNTWHVNANHN